MFFLPLYAQNWADYGGSADSAQYSALKLLARELRGGAIVFLMPQSLIQKLKKSP